MFFLGSSLCRIRAIIYFKPVFRRIVPDRMLRAIWNHMKVKFIKIKSCRLPTVWGWLVFFVMAGGLAFLSVRHLNSFLSMSEPADARIMVVEGWLPDYALREALAEFKRMKGSRLITTGGPLEKGYFLSEYKTFAQITSATLKKMGLDSAAIITLPTPEVLIDRTYASACEVKKWIERSGMPISAINLISLGPHTRRSRLLYEKAFEASPKIPVIVGAIALPDQMYDRRSWWKTSWGFRAVTDELIAYFYARFIFSPK